MIETRVREMKYIGELPAGYEYKFMKIEDQIRIIGISFDKNPPIIGFILRGDQLEPIKYD